VRFGIIAALAAEAQVFRQPQGSLLDQDEYVVNVCGPGRENAARAAHKLVRAGCEVLVSWGVAGALDEQLKAGDLIVCSEVMTAHGEVLSFDDRFARQMTAQLVDVRQTRAGIVLTMADAAASSRDKAHLRAQFGADAIDLESSAIAYVARSAKCGYLAVRAIVDPATFDVPPAAFKGLDNRGKLQPLHMLSSLAERPTQIPQLLRLAGHFRESIRSLRQVARRITV